MEYKTANETLKRSWNERKKSSVAVFQDLGMVRIGHQKLRTEEILK